jgi:hypothetical protein
LGQVATPAPRRAPNVDPALVARAEAALDRLSVHFGPWMNEEIGLLTTARARVHTEGLNPETGEHLSIQAHEVKGLAATFGFPVVTHIAGSLCKLIEDPDTRLRAPMFLVDAHIDAIAAALRAGIRDINHPTSLALIGELQARVREAI